MTVAKRGRPAKDKYNIKYMIGKIEEYIKETELPILKEVCYKNDWNYDYVMQLQRQNKNLSQSTKKLLNKKEAQLERLGLYNEVNSTLAVFSLKQLGWRDKQEDDKIQDTINNAKEVLIKIKEITNE